MIKVGYLVSYDYKFIFKSLDCIYNYVDEIFLAIDVNNQTWTGNRFTIPNEFFDKIKKYDKKNIIKIYRDNFYVKSISSLQNEVRERNMLLKKMGKGWLLQIDVDEYPINFKYVADLLNKKKYLTFFPFLYPVTIFGYLTVMFKTVDKGYLCVKNIEKFSFITNHPKYTHARRNKNSVSIRLKSMFLHQSWARSPKEIQDKIKSWGHNKDFDVDKYYDFWKSIDLSNYKTIKNFHPLKASIWEELIYIKDENYNFDMKDLESQEDKLNFIYLFLKNLLRRLKIQ